MNTRRRFITKLGSLAALLTLSSSGNVANASGTTSSNKPEGMNGKFFHVVFFWLINEEQETKKKFLTELRNFINNVELIKSKHIGSPADTNREVIDNTYSYSLILSFESKKEQDLYQEHHLHKEFIKKASSLWERVLVYDSQEL